VRSVAVTRYPLQFACRLSTGCDLNLNFKFTGRPVKGPDDDVTTIFGAGAPPMRNSAVR
jgi:hypothetical protein